MLELDVRHRLGEFTLAATFSAPAGSVTVLVGENGSGKSTLLRLVAGLAVPDEGRIALGGDVLVDRAAGRFAPPEARSVGWVAQDYALFPHLTVRENVAFGLHAARPTRRDAVARTEGALVRFALADLAERRPAELSGGQQQRVALARALVLEPRVLLLDEPLAALDPVTRRAMRGELRRRLEPLPCVTLLVTHDPTEAMVFGDRVAVLEAGRVTQEGTREQFARAPRTAYAAEFLGVNLFEGSIAERGHDGLATLQTADGTLAVPDPGAAGHVRAIVHPHDVTLSLAPPEGSARNVLHGPIDALVPEPPSGERVRVRLASRPPLVAQVTAAAAHALGLRPGLEVWASFKATAVTLLED